ncbi:rhodanese-like domain-containing protein [Geothrix alkalitolerans]|uniref:rhodanese-like domain-containing protein n=1 Tax=Geothrix alkalitolerans TaxID=2922724 RepID=UPI001FAF8F8D|nr:rhodanese-like domain-containing protein [Geothrix alkalitolerans]
MGIFEDRGMVIAGLRFLAPKDALAALNEGAVLVDLRLDELAEMKAFQVPETIRIPHEELASLLSELPADRPLLLADSAGVYTKEAAHLLLDHGFANVACLNGGMLLWDQEGWPVTTDAAALLHGQCPCVLRPRKGRR